MLTSLKNFEENKESEIKKFVCLTNTGNLLGIKITKSVNFNCSPVATSNNILYTVNRHRVIVSEQNVGTLLRRKNERKTQLEEDSPDSRQNSNPIY